MRDFWNAPVVQNVLASGITLIFSIIAGLLIRKREKKKLRKKGYLRDAKF